MEKIFTCIKNIGVWHSFDKMKPQLCFFLKKTFLVIIILKDSFCFIYGVKVKISNLIICILTFFVFLITIFSFQKTAAGKKK